MRRHTRHTLWILAMSILLAAGCGGGGSSDPGTPLPASMQVGQVAVGDAGSSMEPRWYEKGAIIEINVRAYNDSDGDGVGDLNGVTAKLDYLKDLGVVGIWLMPVYKTDDHDSGYIITDHRDLETEYGTLADFQRLVAEAHKRGIGIVMDYVMNHSAATDPLFVSSSSAAAFTRGYRDWYVWQSSDVPGYEDWRGRDLLHRTGNGYYYAYFETSMPDFNLRNADVVEYHKNNLRYWLNLGVDGFRFDAIDTFVENGPGALTGQPESYALMHEMRKVIDGYANRYVVCESADNPARSASDAVCGSAFAFGLHDQIKKMATGGVGLPDQVVSAIAQLPSDRMATLLANHDRFAGLRLMDEFGGDETSYRLAAATLLTLPGVPFIYYGEEVGMRDMPLAEFDASSDWPLRGPMSWSEHPSVTRNTLVGPYNYFRPTPDASTYNVARESGDAGSLWSFYRSLLNLRKNSSALREGSFRVLRTTATSLAYERRTAGESVVVVFNYGTADVALALASLPPGVTYSAVLDQGAAAGALSPDAGGATSVTAPGRSVQVFRAALGG